MYWIGISDFKFIRANFNDFGLLISQTSAKYENFSDVDVSLSSIWDPVHVENGTKNDIIVRKNEQMNFFQWQIHSTFSFQPE